MITEYLPIVILITQIILGIIAYFIKREMDFKDKQITNLEERVHKLSNKIQAQEVSLEGISTKIDILLNVVEKLEDKLDEKL